LWKASHNMSDYTQTPGTTITDRPRIGKLNGIFASVSPGTPPRNPTAWALQRLWVPLPARAGQCAGEVQSAFPGCSGGAGLGTAPGGRQGRADGTRECPDSTRTAPMGRHHGAWT